MLIPYFISAHFCFKVVSSSMLVAAYLLISPFDGQAKTTDTTQSAWVLYGVPH